MERSAAGVKDLVFSSLLRSPESGRRLKLAEAASDQT